MFCLEIRKLPFRWQPSYFRPSPWFIHISPVQAAKLKSSTPDAFDPSDVFTRSFSVWRMFSTFSVNFSHSAPGWPRPHLVPTTLGHSTLASEEPVRLSPAAWCGRDMQPASHASEWSVSHRSVWALLLWSRTTFCYRAWGTACLAETPEEKKKEKKQRRVGNQFLIKQICKGCIKKVSNICFGLSCQLDATLRIQRVARQTARADWGRRCCFRLPLDW